MNTKNLLKRVYQQTMGDHLRAGIHDEEMICVYLSAGLLREIAKVVKMEIECGNCELESGCIEQPGTAECQSIKLIS